MINQNNSLVQAAKRHIINVKSLIASDETPFNVVYHQYKSLQTLWFRIIEVASESNSKVMETLCVELEATADECEKWIARNSPTTGTRIKKEKKENVQETK